jgi:hypothetical protein
LNISFLTPIAGLVTVAAAVPLVAFVRSEQRAARVRELLRLAPPGGSQRQTVAAIVVLAVLVGIGAAQPVIEKTREQAARSDAPAFFVIDTSRSMLASSGPGDDTRFDRAQAAAIRFRDGLATVPVGIASLTDRALPHIFPTANRDAFVSTLRLALGVDRPPSSEAGDVRATKFSALAALGNLNFFRGADRRLAVVFSDAETTTFYPSALSEAFNEGNVDLIVLRFGRQGERVYGPDGAPEPYEADPGSAEAAQRLASVSGSNAFHEDELDAAIGAARRRIGEGETAVRSEQSDIEPLGPYPFLAALLPLGFLLHRRNLA